MVLPIVNLSTYWRLDFTAMFFQPLWVQFCRPLDQCKCHFLQEALCVYISSPIAHFHICLPNQAVGLSCRCRCHKYKRNKALFQAGFLLLGCPRTLQWLQT